MAQETVVQIQVSVGDLLDRISICKVKLANVKNPVDLVAVQKEFDILRRVRRAYVGDGLDREERALLAINRELWDACDVQHSSLDDEDPARFIESSRRVVELNRDRSGIKAEIDRKRRSGIREIKQYGRKADL